MGPGDADTTRARERWLVALVALGAFGAMGAWMTWASFSATTTNEGNIVSAGTVQLEDDAASQPLYDVAGRGPGSVLERCIEVTYTGSLPADVRLHVTPVGSGDHVAVEVTQGTGGAGFPACDGFVPSGAPLFRGTLSALAAGHDAWATGIEVPPPTLDGWTTGTSASFRFRLEQLPTEGLATTSSHRYIWEARNR